MNAVFIPQTSNNDKLIGDFQAFVDLMQTEGLSAEDLAKEIGDVDKRIVNYAKSTDVSKLSTDGFKKSIGELSISAKAGKIALQGLALVGNALAMAFASWVATEIISWLNDLAHAEENARKRSEELTSSYETEKKNIDDSIAKYKELSEKLDDTSLSTSEVKSIKEQLLGIQDKLNEKYGAEATQIDLVNGKYDEQIKKLDILAKKKANEYVNKNYNDIKEDEKYVSEKFNVNKSLGFKGSQANPDDYSGAGFDFKKYLDRYDKLDAKVVNPDGQYGMSGTVNLITSGTRQEVYDQINSLLTDLRNDFGESNPNVVALQTTLSNILNDSFDTTELANANSRIKKYAEAEILSNDATSKSYNDLVDAVDNYNTALKTGDGVDEAKEKLLETKQAAEDSTKDITNSGKVLQDVYDSLSGEAPIEFQVEIGKNVDENLQKSYEDTINRFKANEESNLDELKQSYQEAIDKRNELYSGTDYVGNVDINNRPVVINDDGSYSTTSTSFQEKWVGDEENGHYIIAHFTPILPDGTVLDDDSLNEYIDKILNSADPMEADKVENGGKGIVYKVDTQINGKDITDDNLEDAFGVADAWDVDMHNLQDKMYKDEAAIKAQIAKFDDDVDGSQKIKDFFDTEGINTDKLIDEFNDVTKGINDADEAIQAWNEHKKDDTGASTSLDLTSFVEKADSKDTKTQNLAWLQTEADLLKTIQKEISETGRISVSSMQSMLKQFPEANEALSKYMVGLIDEQELFEELQSIYDDDAKAYAEKMYKELEVTDEFLDSVKKEYPELFDTLYNLYQDDLGNYTNLAELKKQIDVALVTALDKLWANHYQLIYDNASNAYSAIIDDQAMLDGTLSTEESENILNGISSEVDKANTALQELEKIKDSFVNKITSDSSWSSLGKDSSSKGSSSSKDTKKQFDWLERAIKKVQNAYSRLKNVVSDTTRSWSTRNNALIQSQQELTRQINLQSQAYEYYMQLFNALDLDDYYKKLIMDGAMLVETITDPDLLEVINKAIELFDKAEEAKNNVSSLTSELHELSTQLFNNTAKEFQGKINVYEHAMKTLENGVSLIETKGYKVTASLYEEMISETQDRIGLLQQERSALESAMASADVEVGSEAWMDMYNQILDVDNAIQEATISLAEFNNELRQLKWDKFDDIQSGIQETVDEAEFMYKLLENRGLTNDTGGLNDNGIAAQGLLAEKYNLYMAMADKYAKEVKSIDAELASDPGNTKLLERRQELLKAQRDAILNAEDEKESIKSLIEESYNKLGDTLSDLISKYKDFMKTIKDTYNYEKSMAEKTKQLADLQKQFNAVRNDNSEEGMSRRQQLEDQIKTSQDDIQQTEYEKLISDTEALLDKFSSEYEEWLTNLVTELETTLQMAIDQTNQYSDQILSTLNDQAYNVGYTLSDATTAVFDSIGDSVAMYGQGFLDSANGINSSIMLVENAVEAVYNAVQAQAIAQQAIAQAQSQIAGAMMGGGSSGSQSTSGDALSGSNDTGSGGGNSIGVGSIMTLKDGSEYWETSWGNGRSGSKYAGVQGGVIIDEMSIAGLVDGGQNDPNAYGDHYVHIRSADGVYRDLGWVRWEDLEEYGTGTRNAKNDLAWTQDGGSEIIRTADGAVLTPLGKGGMVFNNKSSNNLYDFGEDPKGFIEKLNLNNYIPNIPNINLPKLDTVNKSNGDVNMGGVSFNFGQIVANNPEEFATQLRKTMASNSMVQKMVQEVVLGQSLGHNSLNTKRYL